MAEKKTEKKEQVRGNTNLPVHNLVQASAAVSRWVASVPACDKSRLADPAYWAHVSRKLHPCSHIEVHAEDMSFWCELLVVSSGNNWAKVKVINACDIEVPPENEADLIEGYTIQFKGPVKGHTIVRTDDLRIIKEGLPTRNDAVKYVVNHKTTVAA